MELSSIKILEQKKAKLSSFTKKWLKYAIDSKGSVLLPQEQSIDELKQFVPSGPVTLYRGLLFLDEIAFIKFIKESYINNNLIKFKPNKYEKHVSSWSYKLNDALSFATSLPSENINSATLNWLIKVKNNKAIEGKFGIVVEATIDPKDILVDMTIVSEKYSISTSKYSISDEVFVFPDVIINAKIIELLTEKGKIPNDKINEFIKSYFDKNLEEEKLKKLLEKFIIMVDGLSPREFNDVIPYSQIRLSSPKDIINSTNLYIKAITGKLGDISNYNQIREYFKDKKIGLSDSEIEDIIEKNKPNIDDIINREASFLIDYREKDIQLEKFIEYIKKNVNINKLYEKKIMGAKNRLKKEFGENSKFAFIIKNIVKQKMEHYNKSYKNNIESNFLKNNVIQKIIEEEKHKIIKIINFPEFRQAYVYDCGASAVQAILAFFGIDEREEIILQQLRTDENSGTSISNIKRVLNNEYNIKTKEFNNLTINSLKKLLNKNIPVLMLIQAWPDEKKKSIEEWENEWEEGHYVIAVGYTDKEIIFEDPSSVVRTYIPFEELDKRWHDSYFLPSGKEKIIDHWGMIFLANTDYKYDEMNVIKMD